MKYVVIVFLLTACLSAHAQKDLGEYKASNGITYHTGDTVKLGRGSAPNGNFRYVEAGGMMASTNPDLNTLGKQFSGTNAIIKKIIIWKKKGAEKFYLIVGVGLMTNYYVAIEDAIETCEVAICKGSNPTAPPAADKYDQLKKLKTLLDEGVITQEEYDKEKAKILSGS